MKDRFDCHTVDMFEVFAVSEYCKVHMKAISIDNAVSYRATVVYKHEIHNETVIMYEIKEGMRNAYFA